MGFTCCFSGYSDIPNEKLADLKTHIEHEIKLAIENGCTHFISKVCSDIDLFFMQTVITFQDRYPHLTLEASLPYKQSFFHRNKKNSELISKCTIVRVNYKRKSMKNLIACNNIMTDLSQIVLVVYDENQPNESLDMVQYAYRHQKNVRIIII